MERAIIDTTSLFLHVWATKAIEFEITRNSDGLVVRGTWSLFSSGNMTSTIIHVWKINIRIQNEWDGINKKSISPADFRHNKCAPGFSMAYVFFNKPKIVVPYWKM